MKAFTGWKVAMCLVAVAFGNSLFAAAVDESRLPPPATVTVDFNRDIKPILDESCLRCHGPEKPKGGFRVDTRELALKGGDNGVAIIPGESAQSPFIHYVAHLVEDMEMPPVGKGDQLTTAQVALLRAWIDQGVVWEVSPSTNQVAFTMAPTLGWTTVKGDEHKFRELNWQKEGFNGGAEFFEFYHQPAPHSKFLLNGHALVDDYKIALTMDKTGFGFVHTGWDQYRKYYDVYGGYNTILTPAAPPPLPGDLHLDIGSAWIDFGLTLPKWPRLVLGYEYDYTRGNKSMTSWGAYPFNPNDPSIIPERNIAPTSKNIDEGAHLIKFDFDAAIHGVAIEDRFRGQFYQLNTHYTNLAARGPVAQNASQKTSYFQGANSIRLEKKFYNWLLGSAGYLYSQLNADGNFTNTATYAGAPYTGTLPQYTLERESHVFNVNSLVEPFGGLTFSAGVQSEWTRETGFGNGDLHRLPFTYAAPPLYLVTTPTALNSDHDENSISELFAVRYNQIPFTLLFAEGRLQQQKIGQSDSDIQSTDAYLDNIDFTGNRTDLRAGFTTSPWRTVSFTAHYRWYDNDSQYRNNQPPQPPGTYPGFIRSLDIQTDEVEAKLVLRPIHWFKTTLSYQYLTTDSRTDVNPASGGPVNTDSPGGSILAGESDSQTYSIALTFTPRPRFFLDMAFAYQPSSTTTAVNGAPAIVPYQGDIYSVTASGTYVLNAATDLFGSYTFSTADFAQNNYAAGQPVGIQYEQHAVQIGLARRLGKNVSAQLRYGFYKYDEPSSGGADNYIAQSVFGVISLKLP
ncbi:MAG TPA: c-type cytochrome domain-containing protein [Verrucomicrobiae bacterium]|nr:c-type cytochrome domain-containing protein [Verrucomicrobiae bacterium]